MSKALTVSLLLSLLGGAVLLQAQDDAAYQPFSPDQLDNLLAPVALYPDPILAQVLLAATFPDQVDEAARFCRGGANPDDIDTQPWDVSVKAVAHYPTVIYMADNLDWTTALGQAYISQAADVMAAVQRLRQEARDAGNLATTPQQDVEVDDGGDIEIWPAQPQYCYVPIYDPALVFFGSGGVYGGPIISFSAGFPIGAWLVYDFDWRHRRIYYRGWSERSGWIVRSLPYVHINGVYVNDNLKNIAVGRSVTARKVNYANLTRYNSVHQDVEFGSARTAAGVSSAAPVHVVDNKIIQRNADVTDARIDSYRGRAAEEPAAGGTASNHPAPPAAERARTSAFGGSRGNFDAKASSQRGQSSRAQASHPAPAASGGSHGGGGGSHGGGGGRH
jgi:uncharacterized membrane protein YgcG